MLLFGQVSGQQAKEEVSQLVRGLGAVLEEKRASLLQAIEECQQERLARLSAQIQEHRSLLDGSGLVGYAQEVLKETDQPCFVQAAKQLHNRYTGTAQGHRLLGAGASWVQPLWKTASRVLPNGEMSPEGVCPATLISSWPEGTRK